MDVQNAYQEERARLEETLGEIESQLNNIPGRYYGDDYVEQLLDAKRQEKRQRLELLNAEPYFGRLDFREAGKHTPLPLYIGKRGMDRSDTGDPYIIDWRAPVASLFYSFTGGDVPVQFEAPEGTVEGEVFRKRNLSIREQSLERVVDSYVRGGDNLGLSDEFLLYRLGEKKDNRLRDIVSTIQAEQDKIIRAQRNTALIIQGAAGSGKTTVALHRLAFLLYQYQEQVRAERMIIFAPNAMFLDYISGVLPELGVGHVRQTTFAEWAWEILKEQAKPAADATDGRWFTLEGMRPKIDTFTPGRYKGSIAFKTWIDERLQDLEKTYLPELDFEPWGGHRLPYAAIREWFETEYRHYPLAARRERLLARMNRWMEMAQNAVADPKKRKELGKTGKQRLRAYGKKLPELGAMAVYKLLFGSGRGGKEQSSKIPAGLPAAIAEQTRRDLDKGVVRPEDLPPLLWIHFTLNGLPGPKFDHVVIDEAQDVSPFQVELLKACMNEPSFTILGDLAQGIHAYRGIHKWEEVTMLFGAHQCAYHELRQSYRSTLEIIEFANTLLPFTGTSLPPAQPVFRSGEPVEVIPFDRSEEVTDWVITFLADNRERGMRTTAVIGRTEKDCGEIHEQLKGHGVESALITEGQQSYSGGVSVVPVHLAKGLEFDAVVLLHVDPVRYTDTPQDAKLLYVGCTRALHRLALSYLKAPSPLIEDVKVVR
ncbi:3'-5' exonuclease [Paenibacillus tarimensis]